MVSAKTLACEFWLKLKLQVKWHNTYVLNLFLPEPYFPVCYYVALRSGHVTKLHDLLPVNFSS